MATVTLRLGTPRKSASACVAGHLQQGAAQRVNRDPRPVVVQSVEQGGDPLSGVEPPERPQGHVTGGEARGVQVSELDKLRGLESRQRRELVDGHEHGRAVALLVADDVLQHRREDALLLRRPAVKTVAERQDEARLASAETPAIGGLPEERRQQILTPAVQVSVHDRLGDPARIVAQECRNACRQSSAVVARDLVQRLAGNPGTRVAGVLFENVQQRREGPEAPAKHGGGAEDGVVALTRLPRLQHREQRWRDASHIDSVRRCSRL